ncbi:MAG: MFS transporter [Ramlibacter sp.]|nr:MFS transporter [Ramlibacter sp.]
MITLGAACLISLLSFGVRGAFGLFTDPLSRDLGTSREVYSIAIAIQNLCWGIAQPFAGMVADRHGARRVLLGGATLYVLGIVGMVFATTPGQIYLTAGVLAGVGMGGASFVTVLSALGRAMPETHRSWALGLGTAAGSLGQFVVVPLTQAVIDLGSWRYGAWALAASTAIIVALAFFVRGDKPLARPAGSRLVSSREIMGTAFRHPSYILLVMGFLVCGFQLAFITTHFPPYLSDKGLGAGVASWAIAMVGLFNVLGAYIAGVWGARYSKKNMLSVIYFSRAAIIAVFIMTPITTMSVLLFGAAMGLLWLSTVPLTSGLVATFFGTRYMATLFGVVFFSHQVGSFFGVLMGGYLFERTGSYDIVWWFCIGLSVLAGFVNLPIRERESQPFSRLAAA